jgi:hypothetical protein
VVEALIWVVVIAGLALAMRYVRVRRNPRVGAAGAGTIYDWLNEDKRRALEIVVDGQAERQDGEHADGNLPELENPTGASSRPPAK